ncbi:MAG: hypothetical protein IT442_05000 [Phycisphaeraceae bacterium]|nr:hypothetical protein [Phycisphaeraceae bacterium]
MPPFYSSPKDPEVQAGVWQAYLTHGSVLRVTQQTGYSAGTVIEVLRADPQRLMDMVLQATEAMVSRWEAVEKRTLDLVDRLLALFDVLLREVEKAMGEQRDTRVIGKEGMPMPVMDLLHFMVTVRLIDSVGKIAVQARNISAGFRTGRPAVVGEEEAGGPDTSLDPVAVARRIQAAGLGLPPMLDRLLKRIDSQTVKPEPVAQEKPRPGGERPGAGEASAGGSSRP